MSEFVVSVIIPAYNAAERIAAPLKGLAAQDDAVGRFEVIVVDNASTDRTADAVEQSPATADLRRRGHVVRVLREPRPGLVNARMCGILEAQSEVVAFIDDDNDPEPGYLAAGVSAMADPTVGLLVSRVIASYEIPAPPSVRKRESILGTSNFLGDQRIVWGPETVIAPTIGAGMWVRRDLFLGLLPWDDPGAVLSGRTGNSLISGEDIEIGVHVGKAGYNRVYVPEMRVRHIMPERRQQTRYFSRLIVAIVRSLLTVRARYCGYSHRPMLGVSRLALALAAAPIVVLRNDGRREILFILAGRWAEILGPFRDLTPPTKRGHS